MTPPELRDLLSDALTLWDMSGRVVATGGGVVLVTSNGMSLSVSAAAASERPIRWWVDKPTQRRACTSVAGLLRTLRNAVGAGEAEARRLRVAEE